MVRRVLSTLVVAAGIIAAATLTLPAPNLSSAVGFFGGSTPSIAAGEAVVGVLGWAVVVVGLVILLAGLTRGVSASTLLRRRKHRAAIVLVVGILLLVVSSVHRIVGSSALCCGSNPQEVRQVVDLAP
jgi:hypothetical protein